MNAQNVYGALSAGPKTQRARVKLHSASEVIAAGGAKDALMAAWLERLCTED